MADVTTPFGFPYPEPTDLVRDGATDIEALAQAVNDAGVDGTLGGLVAVKSAIFTGIQSDNVTGSGNVAVTDLEIEHALADASNRLIISAFLGAAANSIEQGNVGIAVDDGTGLIAIGASPGSRTAVTAGGIVIATSSGNLNDRVVTMPSVTFVHTPGDTTSRTYTVRAININAGTRTLFINRGINDDDAASRTRAVSSLVIQEVSR